MMQAGFSPTVLGRLTREDLFWLATVRPAGTPHLAPLRYVWHNERLYIFTRGTKLSNLRKNPAASLALQDGVRPVILEGKGVPVTDRAVFEEVAARYQARFMWDIRAETDSMQLVEILPRKVLHWNGEARAEELPISSSPPLVREDASITLQRAVARLYREHIIWVATVRPDGRPHLVPIWHVWHEGKVYISTGQNSVKMRNIRRQPQVVLALPNAMDVVLVRGIARSAPELDDELAPHFMRKFDWDFRLDSEYGSLVQITPAKIITWQGDCREQLSRAL